MTEKIKLPEDVYEEMLVITAERVVVGALNDLMTTLRGSGDYFESIVEYGDKGEEEFVNLVMACIYGFEREPTVAERLEDRGIDVLSQVARTYYEQDAEGYDVAFDILYGYLEAVSAAGYTELANKLRVPYNPPTTHLDEVDPIYYEHAKKGGGEF